MLLENLAILATGLFTGAAIYITAVEHPARLAGSTAAAVEQWRPSYRRATVMQASLAVVGTLLAVAAGFAGGGAAWLVAAGLLGAVVPYTLVVMFPTNRRLEDPGLDPASGQARDLLIRWGRMHAVRSALGFAALATMLLFRG